MTVITLLHPGSMGAAVGAQAVRGGARVLWVPTGRSAATAERAERSGLEGRASLAEALLDSDLVISVCPSQAAEDIALQVAGQPFGGVFVDANAVSPQRALRFSEIFRRRGTPMVDGVIFGAPPTGERRARLYVAGDPDDTAVLGAAFDGTNVDVRPLDGPIGTASALKMAFTSFQRSARTLTAVAHALAAAHGVGDALNREAEVMVSEILSDPGYLPSVAARAWRWIPEMEEIAATLDAAGLPDDLARATATVMRSWEKDKDRFDIPLDQVLERLRTTGSTDGVEGDSGPTGSLR
ncbi:DUF1932 domain-containing protein [Streptomyces sp. B1866]|uniref:NAD(P)-dependent oxidoreductase n=1 Tax=Streptomyces sp. B1866 TaxID=3075431 RepID=UPI00288C8098|nr:DUF1932 domain-containing protein [Streptomyces sp. B1866]MDT3395300.1 DUF1932 domain-containing protein [Streptomyces sp. B1866]